MREARKVTHIHIRDICITGRRSFPFRIIVTHSAFPFLPGKRQVLRQRGLLFRRHWPRPSAPGSALSASGFLPAVTLLRSALPWSRFRQYKPVSAGRFRSGYVVPKIPYFPGVLFPESLQYCRMARVCLCQLISCSIASD